MLELLILLPFFAGILAFVLSENRDRIRLLLIVSALHLAGVVCLWFCMPCTVFDRFLGCDPLGKLVLTIVSVLFFAVSLYFGADRSVSREGSNRGFIGFLFFFLSSMTLTTLTQHMGILWVAIESTTLFSAPLIHFHRNSRSLEATWKYLLICSVGIAIALVGTYFLGISAVDVPSLTLKNLRDAGSGLSLPWLKLSVIFLFVGYGTKMGLAPMHTWLPDAHGEAPSGISALLSGALLNCAFLAILRVMQICYSAGIPDFAKDILIVMGILSLFVAAVFIMGQKDYKRMLAYSSVENMGILALGVGLGGAGLYGSLWHMINNAFGKAMIFLVTGNIYQYYHSKKVEDVHGLYARYPATGMLWILGFGSIAGLPPFGTFFSEILIFKAALGSGRYWISAFYVIFLALIFIGMARNVLKMFHPSGVGQESEPAGAENWKQILPIVLLGLLILGLGIRIPDFLGRVLEQAALSLGS